MPIKYFSPHTVAETLDISYRKVLDLIKLGKITAIKIDKVYRISESELNRFQLQQLYKPYL